MKTVTTGRTYRVVPIETGAITVGASSRFHNEKAPHSVPALSLTVDNRLPVGWSPILQIELTP